MHRGDPGLPQQSHLQATFIAPPFSCKSTACHLPTTNSFAQYSFGEWTIEQGEQGLRAHMSGINNEPLRKMCQMESPSVPIGRGSTIKWVPPHQVVTEDGVFLDLKCCQQQEGAEPIRAPLTYKPLQSWDCKY